MEISNFCDVFLSSLKNFEKIIKKLSYLKECKDLGSLIWRQILQLSSTPLQYPTFNFSGIFEKIKKIELKGFVFFIIGGRNCSFWENPDNIPLFVC